MLRDPTVLSGVKKFHAMRQGFGDLFISEDPHQTANVVR